MDTHPLTICSAAAIQEFNRKLEQKDSQILERKRTAEELKEAVGRLASQRN